MKSKILVFILLISTLTACSQKINLGQVVDVLTGGSTGGALSTSEIAAGLKQALEVGVSNGSEEVSKVDGYFSNPKIKIPFPKDVQKVETTLRNLGLGSQVDKFVLSLNRGAEEAAKEAKPIFIAAIKKMTITDALSILKGDKDAATQYLIKSTTPELIAAFSPVVEKALDKTQATKYYTDLANIYNKIPTTTKVNPDLKGYATEKAVEGLFIMIAEEEAKIRENPLARTTDLLKKVFGAQDK